MILLLSLAVAVSVDWVAGQFVNPGATKMRNGRRDRPVAVVLLCARPREHRKSVPVFKHNLSNCLGVQVGGGESSVLEAQQRSTEGKLHDLLERHISSDHFATFQALCSECVELEQRSADLRQALDLSLAERMLQLLGHQMHALQEVAASAQRQAAVADSKVRSILPMGCGVNTFPG